MSNIYKNIAIALLIVLIITIILSIINYRDRYKLQIIIDGLKKDLDYSDKQLSKLTEEKNALIADKAKEDSDSKEFPGSMLKPSDKDKKIKELENKIIKLTDDIKNIHNTANEYKTLITTIKNFMLSLNVSEATSVINKIGGPDRSYAQHIVDAFNLILQKREQAIKDNMSKNSKLSDLRITSEEVALLDTLIKQYGSITNLNTEMKRLQSQKGGIVERLKVIREQFEATKDNLDKLNQILDKQNNINNTDKDIEIAQQTITGLQNTIKELENKKAFLIQERNKLIQELELTNEEIKDIQGLINETSLKLIPVQTLPIPDQPIPDQPIPDQPIPDQPTPDQPIPDQPTPDQPISPKEAKLNFIYVLDKQFSKIPTNEIEQEKLINYIKTTSYIFNRFFDKLNIEKDMKNLENLEILDSLDYIIASCQQIQNRTPIKFLKNTILLGYDISGHRINQINDGLYFGRNYTGDILKETTGVCDNNMYCNSITYGTFNKLGLNKVNYISANDSNFKEIGFGCGDSTISDITTAIVEGTDMDGNTDEKILEEVYESDIIGKSYVKLSDVIKKDPMLNYSKTYKIGYKCANKHNSFLNSIDNNTSGISFDLRRSNIVKNKDYNVYISKPDYINWEGANAAYDKNYNTVDIGELNRGGIIFTRDYDVDMNVASSVGEEVTSLEECVLQGNESKYGSYAYYDKLSNKYMCNDIITATIAKRGYTQYNEYNPKDTTPKIIYIKPGVAPTIKSF
jgi:hypothetical protein